MRYGLIPMGLITTVYSFGISIMDAKTRLLNHVYTDTANLSMHISIRGLVHELFTQYVPVPPAVALYYNNDYFMAYSNKGDYNKAVKFANSIYKYAIDAPATTIMQMIKRDGRYTITYGGRVLFDYRGSDDILVALISTFEVMIEYEIFATNAGVDYYSVKIWE